MGGCGGVADSLFSQGDRTAVRAWNESGPATVVAAFSNPTIKNTIVYVYSIYSGRPVSANVYLVSGVNVLFFSGLDLTLLYEVEDLELVQPLSRVS